ncbi:MAG: ATP-binding cassette domain-containing protein [Sulfolobales archaeon]
MISLELKNVWYRYPSSRNWVLRDVSIDLSNDSSIIVLGPNGAGKSTLMKIVALLYRPTKGEVLVNKSYYWRLSPSDRIEIKRRVVYVHEKPILFSGTVLDNILYGLRIRGIDDKTGREKAIELLRLVGLEDLAKRRVSELSAGQSQIVSIVRALIIEPALLLLDEPFAYLDKDKRTLLIKILREYKENKRVRYIISLHEESLIPRIQPDRVITIKDGRIDEETRLKT